MAPGFGLKIQKLRPKTQGISFRAQGLGFRVQGLKFTASGLGLKARGLGASIPLLARIWLTAPGTQTRVKIHSRGAMHEDSKCTQVYITPIVVSVLFHYPYIIPI